VVVWPATAARAPDRLAYGKHGKALRWHIVALYIDWALSCVTIAALLNGPVVHRKLISSKTVQRILDIFYANLDQGRRPSRTRNIPDPIWDFILQTIAIDPDLFLDEAPKSPRAIPSVTGTQLLRTNKTRKAKKQTTVSSERHVSLRNRREKTSPWVPFVPL